MTEEPILSSTSALHDGKLSAAQKVQLDKLQASSNLFDHAAQIELCVQLIAGTLKLLDQAQREGIMAKAFDVNLRTKRDLLKTLIRVSSESSNYGQTVDFVSYEALAEKARVAENKKAAKLAGVACAELPAKEKLSHEHMVPCADVLDDVLRAKDDAELFLLMNAVGFRALIYRGECADTNTEHCRLERKYKSKVPALIKASDVPRAFHPFARYEAVGLYSELLPVSRRGMALWTAYEKVRAEHFHAGDWKYKDA
jgi:hypothetical protein